MNLQPLTQRILVDSATINRRIVALVAEIEAATLGQPKGQRFEPTSGGATVLWCWEHQREVYQCETIDLDCDGETIEVHDPTGEAAVGVDQARADARNISRILHDVARGLNAALKIDARHADNRATIDRAGVGACADCHKYFDGTKNNRVSAYKGTGDPVCISCRSRRDRAPVAVCSSVLTRLPAEFHCQLPAGHAGPHRGEGAEWSSVGVQVAS